MSCFLETRIPSKAWRCIVMCRVKFIMFETSFAKVFKYIGKQKNIRIEIEIVIIANILAIKCIPHFECVLVILFWDIFIIQFWIKLWFGWELCFRESFNWWNIVIGIKSFLCEKWYVICDYRLCVDSLMVEDLKHDWQEMFEET